LRSLVSVVILGGHVLLEPLEFESGQRIALIADSDGDTMEVPEESKGS
jgi:hypothetical protein